MATGLWALFCATGRSGLQGPLGGFLGFCGWLPFAKQVEALIEQRRPCGSLEIQYSVSKFFLDTLSSNEKVEETQTQTINLHILFTPVFLSHGADDAWVSVELGQQASQILKQILVHVEWHKFSGAEGDGHWIKEPEGFDQILKFLEDSVARSAINAIQ